MIGIMCLYSFTSAVLIMFRWTQISELQLQPQPYPILWKCWWASSDKVPPSSVKSQWHQNRMLEKACMNEIWFSQNKLQLTTTTQGSERGEWLDILFHFVVWPFASLTPLDTFSVLFFFCSFLATCSCFSQNTALKSNGSFQFRRKSEAVMQSSSKHQSRVKGSVKAVNTDRKGWMEHRKGDPHQCLAPSDLLNGFPLSGHRDRGWEGNGVLPTPFGADAVTLSPHASTHLSELCKEANNQATTDVTHPLPGCKA